MKLIRADETNVGLSLQRQSKHSVWLDFR